MQVGIPTPVQPVLVPGMGRAGFASKEGNVNSLAERSATAIAIPRLRGEVETQTPSGEI